MLHYTHVNKKPVGTDDRARCHTHLDQRSGALKFNGVMGGAGCGEFVAYTCAAFPRQMPNKASRMTSGEFILDESWGAPRPLEPSEQPSQPKVQATHDFVDLLLPLFASFCCFSFCFCSLARALEIDHSCPRDLQGSPSGSPGGDLHQCKGRRCRAVASRNCIFKTTRGVFMLTSHKASRLSANLMFFDFHASG